VTIHNAICFLLDLVNPLAINEITTGLWRNQSPGLVPLESIILILHSRLTMRDRHRFLHIIWFTRRCQICVTDRAIGELLWFTNPSLKMSSRGCYKWLRCWSFRRSQCRNQGGFDLGADRKLCRGRCKYACVTHGK
jgi:hypothetical protein